MAGRGSQATCLGRDIRGYWAAARGYWAGCLVDREESLSLVKRQGS